MAAQGEDVNPAILFFQIWVNLGPFAMKRTINPIFIVCFVFQIQNKSKFVPFCNQGDESTEILSQTEKNIKEETLIYTKSEMFKV